MVFRRTFPKEFQPAYEGVTPIHYQGVDYPTLTHAYQAQKTAEPNERDDLLEAPTVDVALRIGRTVELRPDWAKVREQVMLDLLRAKFARGNWLARRLLRKRGEIVAWNDEHDIFWGKCRCRKHRGQGEDVLGRLLMQVRTELGAPLDWSQIYERVKDDVNDRQAWISLQLRVVRRARRDIWQLGWDVVDDVVADTCAEVVIHIEAARGPASFAGFVLGHYLNARKRALRARRNWGAIDAASSPAPDLWEAGQVERARLAMCLEALRERPRRIVELRYFREQDYDQISRTEQISIGNSHLIVHRALVRLRECLEHGPHRILGAGAEH